MPPAVRSRKLECGHCGAHYRSTYRGRRPLCQSCQECSKRTNSLQMSSSPDTSFGKLPMDVLCSLMPHLLVGPSSIRLRAESFGWAQVLNRDRHCQFPHCAVPHVFEKAWVPTIRIKLVCKTLHRAVNEHMYNLLQPREICVRSAAKIQAAAKNRRYGIRYHSRIGYKYPRYMVTDWMSDDEADALEAYLWEEEMDETCPGWRYWPD